MLSRSVRRRRRDRREERRGRRGEEAEKLSSERGHSWNSRAPHLNQTRIRRRRSFWRRFLVRTPQSVTLSHSDVPFYCPSSLALVRPSIHNVRRERREEERRGRLTPFSICTAVATFETAMASHDLRPPHSEGASWGGGGGGRHFHLHAFSWLFTPYPKRKSLKISLCYVGGNVSVVYVVPTLPTCVYPWPKHTRSSPLLSCEEQFVFH